MANNLNNLAIGGADVQVADWVANGGATGHVSVGILKEPPEWSPSVEKYEPEFESLPGKSISSPLSEDFELKVVMAEATLDILQWSLMQPTGNLTGTAPNKTLLFGDPSEQYKGIKVITKGITGTAGTRSTRTVTLHRCTVKKLEPVTFGKGKEQLFAVTLGVLYDTTVTSNDKYGKIVDSGGA